MALGIGGKEQFLRESAPQYGYDAASDHATQQLEIDRMHAQEFVHMQGTSTYSHSLVCCSSAATVSSMYLDHAHAGVTMYSSAQLQNMFVELNSSMLSNPHSHSHSGEQASTSVKVEHVRRQVMRFVSAGEEEYELIFTQSMQHDQRGSEDRRVQPRATADAL